MFDLRDSGDTWHYRRYVRWEQWKQRTNGKYEPRTTLDLCHYVRVVVIFYSWRWPWQREFGRWRVRPWHIPLIGVGLALIAGAIYGLTQVHDWRRVAEVSLAILGGVAVAVAVGIGLIYAFGEKNLHKTIAQSESVKLGSEWIKAKKRRACPISQRPGRP